jgi:Zn-dependent M28 family amino/carboxypeptidase
MGDDRWAMIDVRRMRATARLAAVLTVLAVASASSQSTSNAAKPSCPAPPTLDSAQIMDDVSRLADDSMRGRRIGTSENAKARDFLAARFDALGLGVVGEGRIQKFTAPPSARRPDSLRGANVVGMIQGTRTPDEYIVVTAHFDHLGVGRPVNGDSIYNGADDNASGTVALLAMARHFMRSRPAHSIVFALVDGEEAGDLGSKALVANPPVPLEQMLIDVNMDMVGRNINNELYVAGPAKYPQLRPLVDAAVACSPPPVVLIVGHDSGGRGSDWTSQSDQGSFHAKAIPFVYFGEEDHPDYHRPSDTADHLMPAFFVSSARLVTDFVRRFDEHPVARNR